jgi:hypothetical protein
METHARVPGRADNAPDWRKVEVDGIEQGYPSAFPRTGAAWARAWARLGDGKWRVRLEIAEQVAGDEIKVASADALLTEACRHGVLERQVAKRRGPSGKVRSVALIRRPPRSL